MNVMSLGEKAERDARAERTKRLCKESRMMEELSKAGKEEIALALILWKDFKAQGKMDVEIFKQAALFADRFGVRKEFDELLGKIPALKIEERYPQK